MPVLHQPILGARLNTELHPPPEGIQWWEYLINEGPPATSPGDIPGLLPTYGGGSAPYRHNLVEELPATPVEYPFTRTQGSGSRPWSIGAFLQMQYAYWLRDNRNRARIKTAIENRALIVTEGDGGVGTPDEVVTNHARQQQILSGPPPVISDSGSFTYGHWVAAYAPPAMAASTCGVTVCMRPSEVYKLIRKQALSSGVRMEENATWRARDNNLWQWAYGDSNVTADPGSGGGYNVSGTGYTSMEAARTAAHAAASARSGWAAANVAYSNAVNNGDIFGGPPGPLGASRYTYEGLEETVGLPTTVVVSSGTEIPLGTYTRQGYSYSVRHVRRDNHLGTTGGIGTATVNASGGSYEVHPALSSPATHPVAGNQYLAATNANIVVTAGRATSQDIYTDGIYLDPPDPGYGVGEINLVKANKQGTCEVVALVTGGIEEPYVCNLTPTWPSVPNACEAGAEPLPVNGLTGELCGGTGDADGAAFGDLDINDLWPDFTTVVIPGSTFLLQDGAEEPLYPTLHGSFVYDSHLKRWGKFAAPFSQLLDYSPLNSPKNGLESYAKFGILGGIVDPEGLVRLFDTTPISSKIVYGKYGYFRQGMTSPEEIRVHMRIPCTGTLRIETSIEGKNISTALGVAQPYADANMVTLYGGFDGRWHNAVLEGQFDISYLEFRGITLGKR